MGTVVERCSERRGIGGGRAEEEASASGVGDEREENDPEGARDLKHEACSKTLAAV